MRGALSITSLNLQVRQFETGRALRPPPPPRAMLAAGRPDPAARAPEARSATNIVPGGRGAGNIELGAGGTVLASLRPPPSGFNLPHL